MVSFPRYHGPHVPYPRYPSPGEPNVIGHLLGCTVGCQWAVPTPSECRLCLRQELIEEQEAIACFQAVLAQKQAKYEHISTKEDECLMGEEIFSHFTDLPTPSFPPPPVVAESVGIGDLPLIPAFVSYCMYMELILT